MLTSINNNYQLNFKEMYILKGIGKDVKAAQEKIFKNCNNGLKKVLHPNTKLYPHFYDIKYLYLTQLCSEMQPNVECIIATNKHSKNIQNWHRIFGKPKQEINLDTECNIPQIMQEIHSIIKESKKEVKKYTDAEQANKRGNFDSMADFLIDNYKEAKKILQQIKDVAIVPTGEIKEVDAKKALNAIKNNKFNYISGEILV